jgi:hypothetical protein
MNTKMTTKSVLAISILVGSTIDNTIQLVHLMTEYSTGNYSHIEVEIEKI